MRPGVFIPDDPPVNPAEVKRTPHPLGELGRGLAEVGATIRDLALDTFDPTRETKRAKAIRNAAAIAGDFLIPGAGGGGTVAMTRFQSGARQILRHIRGSRKVSLDQPDMLKALVESPEAAIQKIESELGRPLPFDTQDFVRSANIVRRMSRFGRDRLEVFRGGDIPDEGLISTSTSAKTAQGFAEDRILAGTPEGRPFSKATIGRGDIEVDVNRVLGKDSPFPNEEEIIVKGANFKRGAQEPGLLELRNPSQKFTSAATSLNQIPAGFTKGLTSGELKPGTRNLDIGGGRFDTGSNYLRERAGIKNLVFDPFNRPKEHNLAIVDEIRKNPVDSVTVNNVLNVIDSEAARLEVIESAKRALKPGGRAIFTVFEGNRSGQGVPTTKGFQANLPLKSYLDMIRRIFPDAKVKGGMIVATKE